jgi:hypothetical protein
MLALKIRDPIMTLKPNLHLVRSCLGKICNEIIIRPFDLSYLSCTIYADTHWMLAF